MEGVDLPSVAVYPDVVDPQLLVAGIEVEGQFRNVTDSFRRNGSRGVMMEGFLAFVACENLSVGEEPATVPPFGCVEFTVNLRQRLGDNPVRVWAARRPPVEVARGNRGEQQGRQCQANHSSHRMDRCELKH